VKPIGIATVVVLFASVNGLGCSEGTSSGMPEPVSVSEEALKISAYLANSARPDVDMAKEIDAELDAIRTLDVGDAPDLAMVPFRTPYEWSTLIVGLTENAIQRVRDGTFQEWNELNAEYGTVDIEYLAIGACVIRYNELVYAPSLREVYAGLPDVRYVDLNRFIVWHPSTVYPYTRNSGRSYLVRHAWNYGYDYMTFNEYWYFVIDAGTADFIGYWNPQVDSEHPDWWDDAIVAQELFDNI
jgi:hypothetical protein